MKFFSYILAISNLFSVGANISLKLYSLIQLTVEPSVKLSHESNDNSWIFERLRVPINLEQYQDEEGVGNEPERWEVRPQVTSWSNFVPGPMDNIEAEIDVTPGEYYKESSGRWNRRYGGEYEIITLTLRDKNNKDTREFYELDYYTRPYGTYNRQMVNGRRQWVRLDSYEDFLGIDQTFVQEIKPVTSDRYLDPVDTVFECAGQARAPLVLKELTPEQVEAQERRFFDHIAEQQGLKAEVAALAGADQRAEDEVEEEAEAVAVIPNCAHEFVWDHQSMEKIWYCCKCGVAAEEDEEDEEEAVAVIPNCAHEFVWDRYETGVEQSMGSLCYCSKCGVLRD